MSTNGTARTRRSRTVLSPSAKYEIWLQLLRGEATIGQAATTAGVDRSTIIRLRQVAKDGALAVSIGGAGGRVWCAWAPPAGPEIRVVERRGWCG